MSARGPAVVVALGLLAACEAPPEPRGHAANEALRTCAATRIVPPVTSIASAIDRLNALPAPVDVPCFVASLPRPLSVVATFGVTSAQPAVGKTSPRVFLLLDGVVISVVPDGDGAKLLEFGEWVSDRHTLKGELQLPHDGPFAADAAYTRVRSTMSSPATTCGLCHREERPHDTIANAFVSDAYQPQPGTFVTARDLAVQHEGCIAAEDEGPRCQLFHALFDFGAVKQGAFPDSVGLFAP